MLVTFIKHTKMRDPEMSACLPWLCCKGQEKSYSGGAMSPDIPCTKLWHSLQPHSSSSVLSPTPSTPIMLPRDPSHFTHHDDNQCRTGSTGGHRELDIVLFELVDCLLRDHCVKLMFNW